MFGFLRLRKKGFAAADQQLYRAHFCAACHGMADFSGTASTLLTNYDQTFLQVVLSALDDDGSKPPVSAPCTVVPFRRVMVQPVSAAVRPVLAALNIALVDAKLRDDVADEGSVKARVGASLLSKRTERAHTVLGNAGFDVALLAELPTRQHAAEALSQPTLHDLAAPSAELLGTIFAFVATLTKRLEHTAVLQQLGEALGRFIYVLDAVSDVDDDVRKGRFNALVAAEGPGWNRVRVRAFLETERLGIEKALAALPLGTRQGIAEQTLQTLETRLNSLL
ncbi:MAG: hypothetical protein EB084_26070, partial [Proteobacteria bacterium]|nr:hypothetical protein [Pseudomonadota bacterium]